MSPTELVGLLPILTAPPQDTTNAPTACIHYVADQRHSPPALQFTLQVTNETAIAVPLAENPYDGVTYSLVDATRGPVDMPAPARSAKVRSSRATARTAKLGYLAVQRVAVGDEAMALDEGIGRDDIVLEPGVSLAYDFAIESVSDDASGDPSVPMAAGTYHLVVLLPLTWADDGTRRQLTLRSERDAVITVEA